MQRVYLAGPITGLDYGDATDWRHYADKVLDGYGLHSMSPMRAKDYLSGENDLSFEYQAEVDKVGKFGAVLSSALGISVRDVNDVRRADGVLINFLGADTVSQGTVFEMGMAKMSPKQPPVVIAMEEDNIHRHAFTNEGFIIVDDLDTAINIMAALLSDRY